MFGGGWLTSCIQPPVASGDNMLRHTQSARGSRLCENDFLEAETEIMNQDVGAQPSTMIRQRYLPDSIVAQLVSVPAFLHMAVTRGFALAYLYLLYAGCSPYCSDDRAWAGPSATKDQESSYANSMLPLDVSLKETSICVVDGSGEIVCEGAVLSEQRRRSLSLSTPHRMLPQAKRIGSWRRVRHHTWLWHKLRALEKCR